MWRKWRALALDTTPSGPDSLAVAKDLESLADLLRSMDRADDADALELQALEIRKKLRQ
jgi:hypothetical protein